MGFEATDDPMAALPETGNLLKVAPIFRSCYDALLSLLSIYDIRFLKFVDPM